MTVFIILGVMFAVLDLIVVYSCCKVAGDADALEERQQLEKQLGATESILHEQEEHS